jgi:hypothetical protein
VSFCLAINLTPAVLAVSENKHILMPIDNQSDASTMAVLDNSENIGRLFALVVKSYILKQNEEIIWQKHGTKRKGKD